MEGVKAFIPLNFALMANPVNWVIITLMVSIAGLGMAYIFNQTPQGE